jgi:hypothetical protein
MSIPTFGQLKFTANGHFLTAETAIESQRTSIMIKAEISNENHPLRSARLLTLEQAATVLRHAIEQEQRQLQRESITAEKLHASA